MNHEKRAKSFRISTLLSAKSILSAVSRYSMLIQSKAFEAAELSDMTQLLDLAKTTADLVQRMVTTVEYELSSMRKITEVNEMIENDEKQATLTARRQTDDSIQ